MHRLVRPITALVTSVVAALLLVGPLANVGQADPAPVVPAPILEGNEAGFSAGYPIIWNTPEEQDQTLDLMAATGAKWIRIDFFWNSLQPTADSFSWTRWDQLVDKIVDHGLKIVGIPLYTPWWTRPDGASSAYPPPDLDLWADFLDAIVTRFGDRVKHWEIWNEPNIDSFWNDPNPATYTKLLRRSYTTIKGIDPTATVITGGLSPASDAPDGSRVNPLTFVRGMYAAGAKGYFDAIGVHPYSFPYHPMDPSTASWNTFLRTPLIHDEMVAHGDGDKKIWLTEFGAPTGTSSWGVSEAEQIDFVVEGFTAIKSWPWAGPVFWYSLRDRGTDPTDREENFGIVRLDFSKKLAYNAFDDAVGTPGDPEPPPPPPSVPEDFVSAMAPVVRLYSAYFLRMPDYDGLMFWVRAKRDGYPLPSVSALFATSAEFKARYGSLDDGGFVRLVYNNVLDRTPDATGLRYWLDRLREGSIDRAGLMIGFSEAVEYRNQQSSEVQVVTAYVWATESMPEAAAYTRWVERLDEGTPVSDLLLTLL